MPAEAAVSYGALLRTPGAPRAFTASTLARLSYSTVVLSLLLTVQRATGSFAAAGLCVGAYGASAVLGPLRSRAIDRRGVRAVLSPLAIGYAVALFGAVACAMAEVRTGAPYAAFALVAGILSPPVGPVMRAIWAELAPDAAARQRAYSLDAVVEEVLFATGPVVVGVLVAVAAPLVALIASIVLAFAGSVLLATSPLAGRAPLVERGERDFLGPLRSGPFRMLLLVLFVVGAGLSSIDLAVVARVGNGASAGYVLAALSVGSAIGGLLWGRLRLPTGHLVQLAGLLGLMAVGMGAVAVVRGPVVIALVLGVAGLAIAPIFVVAFLAADDLVAPGSRTEATTWVTTASNVGGAVGAAAFGVVVQHFSPRTSLLAGALMVAAMLPLLALRRR